MQKSAPLCWLLSRSAACGQGKTQSRARSSASGSRLGLCVEVVALCSMCFQTLTHFPGLGVWDSQDQAKDLVCLCSASLPSGHPWPGHSCFPYPWHPIAFSILWHLAEATFRHLAPSFSLSPMFTGGIHVSDWWGCIWAHWCLWALDDYVDSSGVLWILGSAFWQPDLGMLLLSLVEVVSAQAGLSPGLLGRCTSARHPREPLPF